MDILSLAGYVEGATEFSQDDINSIIKKVSGAVDKEAAKVGSAFNLLTPGQSKIVKKLTEKNLDFYSDQLTESELSGQIARYLLINENSLAEIMHKMGYSRYDKKNPITKASYAVFQTKNRSVCFCDPANFNSYYEGTVYYESIPFRDQEDLGRKKYENCKIQFVPQIGQTLTITQLNVRQPIQTSPVSKIYVWTPQTKEETKDIAREINTLVDVTKRIEENTWHAFKNPQPVTVIDG